MGDKLLIRAYNVEVGDCIYCRIPNARVHDDGRLDDFHILIDCGSRGKQSLLQTALAHIEDNLLPDTPDGRKRLDLLVVTHEHQDHIKGFDPDNFSNIHIHNIWMSAAMDRDHPQAENTHKLHGLASAAMRGLAEQGISLSPELAELAELYSIGNDDALQALQKTLPQNNGIAPLYVHADMSADALKLPLSGATIRVLGPENDIDRFYLGKEEKTALRGIADGFAAAPGAAARQETDRMPANIGAADFRRLKARMLSNALAFADLDSKIQNNSCIVLLVEWRGRRLLFVGDCEWEHDFDEGKQNGGWNVMWHRRRAALDAPVDFLKIGHHGSINATPWNDRQDASVTEPGTILDAILPLPPAGTAPTAQALVSTMRKNYKTIPDSALLSVIGRRVANVRSYADALRESGFDAAGMPLFDEFEKAWIQNPQPLRTDFENLVSGKDFIDVEIEA